MKRNGPGLLTSSRFPARKTSRLPSCCVHIEDCMSFLYCTKFGLRRSDPSGQTSRHTIGEAMSRFLAQQVLPVYVRVHQHIQQQLESAKRLEHAPTSNMHVVKKIKLTSREIF